MSADPAIFPAVINEHGAVHLENSKQQRAYCKAKLAGQCVDVIICAQGVMKSRLQEQGFHAMLGPWLKEGHRIDDLKVDLLGEIFGRREHVNPITGEVSMVLNEPHTSSLSRAKYNELIERTLEIAGECGVILEAPHEYRQRKEREARKKAKAA